MRMVARKPVSSSTVTHEFMMLNQWICKVTGSMRALLLVHAVSKGVLHCLAWLRAEENVGAALQSRNELDRPSMADCFIALLHCCADTLQCSIATVLQCFAALLPCCFGGVLHCTDSTQLRHDYLSKPSNFGQENGSINDAADDIPKAADTHITESRVEKVWEQSSRYRCRCITSRCCGRN